MISNKIILGRSTSISKLSYKDPKYGFSLRLPSWWKRFIVVKSNKRLIDAEYGVFFFFKYKGKVYEEVLSLLVFRMTRKQWRKKGYDDSPIIFLAERNGLIFAYTVPGELPADFLSKSKQDYDYKKYGRPIRLLKRMVNEDVPKIVKTLGIE
ncbi:hypothetical protein D7Z26_14575 [Cohnella endophytica]|uniref:Uncharacterized protein n=1 Tax=Cohnella endophytica TaxID=2419778 RepID=A0A494XQR1_9BACL|nr:hypothetical protein [Cohnella endophytica]RKP52967.1 hypothetical protein D7Z26_14575 [Cohnella endophytica]